MDGSVKKSLIERVAESLRARLSKEGADTAVPSCRELSGALDVSVPTAMGALRLLATEGFLTREPGRKRYQLANAVERESGNPEKRLLVIRPSWRADLDVYSRLRIERLVMESATTGWTVKEEVLSYGSKRRQIDRRWDEVVRRFQPSRIVASQGTPLLARWAAGTGVDTLFLGGSSGSLLIPTLGVSMSASLRSLLPRLLAKGEKLVSMPLCDYGPEFIEAFRRAFSDCLAEAGLPFVPTYHTPATTERGPEALRAMLEMVLKAKPPTTLIFANWRQYVAALGLIGQFGLVPGKSLKVAILWFEEEQLWLDPLPAAFRYPRNRVWQLTMQWMRQPRHERFRHGAIHIPAEFVPGCGIE